MSLLDNLTPLTTRRPTRRLSPLEQALGPTHPLCLSERELSSAVAQLGATGLFLASLMTFARGQDVGVVVFVGVVTLVAISVRLTTAVVRRRLRAVDAIAAGLESAPSACVGRVRRRLLG